MELPTNPNLPAWIITPKEEKAIFERWRKKAFAQCDELIRRYIECSNLYANPLEAIEKCKPANQASLDCVAQYQNESIWIKNGFIHKGEDRKEEVVQTEVKGVAGTTRK